MKRFLSFLIILTICVCVNASIDIYIVGSMNNWQVTDDYKMTETVENEEWTFDFGTQELVGQRFMFKDCSYGGSVNYASCNVEGSLKEGVTTLQYNGYPIQFADNYTSATNVKIVLQNHADFLNVTVSGTFVKNGTPDSGETDTISGTVPSGTLPVLYVTTETQRSVIDADLSHETAAYGTCYIDCSGIAGMESIGDKDNPDTVKIEGRGNYTWQAFEKKPYKLKFNSRISPFGMSEGRSFDILADADDVYSYLRNTVGFEVSRRMGMPWTSCQQPVEMVWNGEYLGLYMFTEAIKVGNGRLNITEQTDSATEARAITGGWLVEVDNNVDSPQLCLISTANQETLRLTGKYPGKWSPEQENYLKNQWQTIFDALVSGDWQTIARYIDIDAAARFYVIQEVLDNREAYNGSCNLYKDIDSLACRDDASASRTQSKWIFGPVWDFGCTFCSYDDGNQKYIWENYAFDAHIINYLHNDPEFMESVKRQWRAFKGNNYDGLDAFVHDFLMQISAAAKNDGARWPQYDRSNVTASEAAYMEKLRNRVDWLTQEWGEGIPSDIDIVENTAESDGHSRSAETFASAKSDKMAYFTLTGLRVRKPSKGGIYIHSGRKYCR